MRWSRWTLQRRDSLLRSRHACHRRSDPVGSDAPGGARHHEQETAEPHGQRSQRHEDAVADNALLVDLLRDALGLTGTKQGCDGGECGACTVLVDGQPRLACITLAATCEGRADRDHRRAGRRSGRMSRLQQAFHEQLGTQCGFCTPGMIMAAEALLRREPQPSEAQIREALAGNLCRCTGYVKIIESVQAAAGAAP